MSLFVVAVFVAVVVVAVVVVRHTGDRNAKVIYWTLLTSSCILHHGVIFGWK